MRGDPRTTHVNVRMSGAERADVEARAARFGMPPSTFMRRAALTCGDEPVRVAGADELRAMRLELKRIGTNLNQAVRALNAHGPGDPTALELADARQVSGAASRLGALIAKSKF